MLSGRRGWSEECVIRHPWNDVMRAVQNKYPNPQNNSVLNMDVIKRSVDLRTGTIHSLKLLNSSFSTFLHLGQLRAVEWSTIDRKEKRMVTVSHNISLRAVMKAVEHLEYSEHPENKDWTLVKHSVTIDAISPIAAAASSTSRMNAQQGREALSWVIRHRLPLLHSFPHWKWNYYPDSSCEEVLPATEQIHTLPAAADSSSMETTGRSSSAPASPSWNWTQGILASPVTTAMAEEPSSALIDIPPSCPAPEPPHSRPTKPRFFSDATLETPSPEPPRSVDSPIHRLGSHFETLTRDVTAMSDALLRRSQRVARLFSKIDEYVVIM
ncbi:PRELI-like family protein [Opisthorchis viverrini]|uniref:PRELI-like family protein n=1 Tax=Opisthorchis viverrini TaxID=6198 RepID=A0A1S8WG18_OPIVI|nr:PRELI-like family protein [Opisthorchis viverrini]